MHMPISVITVHLPEPSCCLLCVCVCVLILLLFLLSSRIAVFSVTVFYDERIVIVAEQRPDASEEDSFQWMSRVLQVNLRQISSTLFP